MIETDFQKVFEDLVLNLNSEVHKHPGLIMAEKNLSRLRYLLNNEEYWQIRILIYVIYHSETTNDARKLLFAYCEEYDLQMMLQYHEEPCNMWNIFAETGKFNQHKFEKLLAMIWDWDLFSAFLIVIGCNANESLEGLYWFIDKVQEQFTSRFGQQQIKLLNTQHY